MIKASPLGLLLLLLALGSARAQTPTGTIAGVITDPSGAAITGARVDIVNGATGQIRTLTTTVDGVYGAARCLPVSIRFPSKPRRSNACNARRASKQEPLQLST